MFSSACYIHFRCFNLNNFYIYCPIGLKFEKELDIILSSVYVKVGMLYLL